MEMSKEEMTAQGRENAIHMLKAIKGALFTGLYFGETSAGIVDCVKWIDAQIEHQERALEASKVPSEPVQLHEVVNDEENA